MAASWSAIISTRVVGWVRKKDYVPIARAFAILFYLYLYSTVLSLYAVIPTTVDTYTVQYLATYRPNTIRCGGCMAHPRGSGRMRPYSRSLLRRRALDSSGADRPPARVSSASQVADADSVPASARGVGRASSSCRASDRLERVHADRYGVQDEEVQHARQGTKVDEGTTSVHQEAARSGEEGRSSS